MKRVAALAAVFALTATPANAAPLQPGVNLTVDCDGSEIDVEVVNDTTLGWRVHHYRVAGPVTDTGYTPTSQWVPAGESLTAVVSSEGDGVYTVTYWVKSGAGWESFAASTWYGCATTN